jgi:hypothetical protein
VISRSHKLNKSATRSSRRAVIISYRHSSFMLVVTDELRQRLQSVEEGDEDGGEHGR